MPFKSRSQAGVCYSKAKQDIKRGRSPGWDCDKWMNETKNWSTLRQKSSSGSPKKHSISKKDFKCLSMNNKDSLIREAKRIGVSGEGTKEMICRRLVTRGIYELGSGPHSTSGKKRKNNSGSRSRSRSRR